MQTQPVQITGYEGKTLTSKKTGKPFTLHLYTASDDRTYSVLDQTINNRAYGAWQNNALVVLEYHEEPNGDYINYRLDGVQPAAQQDAPVFPAVQPDQQFPVAPSPGTAVSGNTQYQQGDQQALKELRIMRQSGLGYAIAAVQAGIWQPSKGMHSVLKYAEYLATDFFVNGPPKVDGDDIPF